MPRTARASVGGLCYHVINRGNGRAAVFHKPGDYTAFLDLLQASLSRHRMRVLAYCLMPNHFHLVVWPRHDGDLSRWMQWLLTAHVRRYHRHYASSGHVWQGRFKAFPVQQDEHLLTVLRYVECNPVRGGLVAKAEDWLWSSLRVWRAPHPWVEAGPVPRPDPWSEWVHASDSEPVVAHLRRCVNRGTPFGTDTWVQRMATRLGLEASVRPRGRPRKRPEK